MTEFGLARSPPLSRPAPPSPPSNARRPRPGLYDIRGWVGAKRAVPHFDDLVFLGASMSRPYPLEGYRERCDTDGRARLTATRRRPAATWTSA